MHQHYMQNNACQAGAAKRTGPSSLFKACTRRKLTVTQALDEQGWTRHLKRDLSQDALVDEASLKQALNFVRT
jgi:hypothetical protein